MPFPAWETTASTTSGWAWPRIMGPQESTWSMYLLPSASMRYGPCASAMNRGVPPTLPNARTGEFTPDGMHSLARPNSWAFFT